MDFLYNLEMRAYIETDKWKPVETMFLLKFPTCQNSRYFNHLLVFLAQWHTAVEKKLVIQQIFQLMKAQFFFTILAVNQRWSKKQKEN